MEAVTSTDSLDTSRESSAASRHAVGGTSARYRVFISYSHSDTKWAKWLMKRLESYRVPRRFRGRSAPIGEIGPRIAPVFRDRDELSTTSDLGEAIRDVLRESATLVVICSQRSARSRWVQEEILYFKKLHGERRVFAFIVDGEPKSAGAEDDCFSPALRTELGADGELSGKPAELVAADARPQGDGPRLAFVRLVSGLLGVGFDELRQRELQRRYRRMTYIAAGSLAGMALTFGLAIAAWQARNDAKRRQDQAEDVLAFMLNDFRSELKKVGRLDLLDKVGDKAMSYFDAMDARDLTDTALARQAKALTQIGEVRMEQKDARYADAVRAFLTAYRRAGELAARHPGNGEFLFERAQAEFWIGFVHRRRGHLENAAEWLTKYRDSAADLVALDATSVRWQRELVAGEHNLAVLEVDRGNWQKAREGFLSELDSLDKLSADAPEDLQLKFRITDVNSWLGTVAERSGELVEALKRFTRQIEGLEALTSVDPGNTHWRFRLADAFGWQSDLHAITGNLKTAREQLIRGQKTIESLTASDPNNRMWLSLAYEYQYKVARIAWTEGDIAGAVVMVSSIRPHLEKLIAAEQGDRSFAGRLLNIYVFEAELALYTEPSHGTRPIARALEIGERLIAVPSVDPRITGDYIGACVTAGRIALATATPDQAKPRWERAVEIFSALAPNSRYWRQLDPAIRAFAFLGNQAEYRRLLERAENGGYVPLAPWPAVAD